MTRALLLTVITTLGCLFAACSSPSESGPESQPLSPELEAMLAEVAAIRGLPAPAGVRIGAIPREEVAAFVRGQLTDADREAAAHITTLYRLLGHLSANQDYLESYLQLLATAAIGFYSPPDRTMWLVRDTVELDPANLNDLERATLAHEFVHAIQDNAFDLERIEDASTILNDASLAISAVLEGDALVHERLWVAGQTAAAGLTAFINASLAQATVPPSLERELRFPYTAGLDWAAAVRAESGQRAIDVILRERRPITTAEIMHPTIRNTGWLPVAVELPDLSAGLPDAFSLTASGTLGEFRLANYLQLRLPSLEALGAAQGWIGDQFHIYESDSQSVAVFRLKFFDAKDAGEFAQAHLRYLEATGATVESLADGMLAMHRDGRTTIQLRETAADEVLFVIGTNRGAAEAAAGLIRNL